MQHDLALSIYPPRRPTMRKADVAMTLKKGADEAAAPHSPIIPPKRSKTALEQVVPEPRGPGHPDPSPPVFIRKMRNAAVGTGCDIRLKVTVVGDPQPSLYWYHNDELLNMENQEYGGLWIRDCKPSDAGLYTCIANNHLGEARTSAVLAVLDLGEDSETTEDEGGDQFETKEDRGDAEDEAVHGGNPSVFLLCVPPGFALDLLLLLLQPSDVYQQHVQVLQPKP
ncbi:PREDICTED: striated muscle preferentially expressed protein kinase-like isoform X1 [Poecilia mexicana]|uniref:striated muscle preferentially expressed protein kinase-like n=2 Tax=Poecilia TaxID=8080 RepID=UPI00072EE67B|nr:PREDICTED: striated muscle preferentially expressed protein kinase-like isoform X1 [Poecilia mexicana]XP_016527062.1 PREDICTED: striated muscle preferentially expressed protein kinase-like [Poecilia formosa]